MKRLKNIILFICVIYLISGCAPKPIEQETNNVDDLGSEEGAQQKLLAFSLSGTEEGKKKWDIEGESADLLSSDLVELSNIKGKTYNKENVITITADSGTLDRKTNDVKLKSNVVAMTDDGVRLTTDRLNWNAQKEKIWTEDVVKVDRDNIKARGVGLMGHPSLEKVKFKRDVTIDIAPSTIITCDGALEVDYKQSIAYLNDNVEVTDERGQLKADKARVYFDKEKKEIKKVIAEGNVTIKRGENITYSEKAIYYADEAKVVLRGKPKFVIYSSIQEENDGFNKD